jgi:hypothetical protein
MSLSGRILRMLTARDNSVDLLTGIALRLGDITTLPTCNYARRGQMYRIIGSGVDADEYSVCKYDGSGYDWFDFTSPPGDPLPLTTLGDLLVHDGADPVRFEVGDDGDVLTANSAAPEGIEWAPLASAGTGYTVGPLVHFHSRQSITGTGTDYTWTNMPLASTELGGNDTARKLVDLTHVTEYLFSVEIVSTLPGSANAVLALEYTTDLDGSSGWTTMGGTPVSIAVDGIWVNSGWDPVPVGANGMVLLRVVGSGGNGAADPRFHNILAQFRGEGVEGPQGDPGAAGADGLITSIGDTATVDLVNTAGALTANVIQAGLTLSSIGGSVTDAQVPNTITLDNLTQITTRSHTALSDIGTNTHAQIDTAVTASTAHIAAANPHSGSQAAHADLDDLIVRWSPASAASGAQLTFPEDTDNGVHVIGLRAPASVAADAVVELPSTAGTLALTAAVQPIDATLTALAAYNTNGILAQTAADTFAGRTITGTANKITVTNGSGVGGDPTITIPDTPTIVTPTIASFVNSTHNHTNAAGGGVLTDAAWLAGQFVLDANGGALSTGADYFSSGGNNAFSTEASTRYWFEFYCIFTKQTAGTVTWQFVNSQTHNAVWGLAQATAIAGVTPNAAATEMGFPATVTVITTANPTFPVSGTLAITVPHVHIIRVYAHTNNAGNCRLRFATSGGTVTPMRGSYYTVRKISGNVGSFVA